MDLEAIYDSEEDIPEGFASLFTEKNGKWELTGIKGIKTDADVARLQKSLHAAQKDNKDLKAKAGKGNGPWGDLDYDETMAKLDRIPELEAAAEGKLDDAKIDDIVAKRLESKLNSKMAPLTRQLKETAATLALEALAAKQCGLLDVPLAPTAASFATLL